MRCPPPGYRTSNREPDFERGLSNFQKNDRFVLLKRLHDLKDKEMESFRSWSNEFPQLAEAHALKEGFLAIWDATTRPEAERAFTRWANDIPLWLQVTFGAIAKTVDTWSDQVFAYWDKTITNAYTEAVNGVAKGMNRMGRVTASMSCGLGCCTTRRRVLQRRPRFRCLWWGANQMVLRNSRSAE